MIGGRKPRSNKGVKRGAYGARTGRTRSGARFRKTAQQQRNSNRSVKKTRKRRSNAGVKRGPRTGRTRSGARFGGKNNKANKKMNNHPEKKSRKRRSNAGQKRKPYGRRTGKTRSGRKFR